MLRNGFPRTALCAALLLASCSRSDRSFLPLGEGTQREYRLWGKIQVNGRPESFLEGRVVRTEILEPREFGGATVYPRRTEIDGEQSTAILGEKDSGLFEVAVEEDAGRITSLNPPSCILPFPLRVGTTCAVGGELGLGDVSFDLSGAKEVEARDETVSVPAGTFRHCTRLKTRATGRARSGEGKVEAEVIEWFAPDVGLVKQISWHVAEPIRIGWGTNTMELVGPGE